MSERDDTGSQTGHRPRGRKPTYADDLDRLAKTIRGGLIRGPDRRSGTPFDSAKKRERWWQAVHWWLKADPDTLRERLLLPEVYRARSNLLGEHGNVYADLPSELVFFLLNKGVTLEEPLIRDTIAFWQRQAVVFDSRSLEATEARDWLTRIDPELIPGEVRGPGHFGVEPELLEDYEELYHWIAGLVTLFEAFPEEDLVSFFRAVVEFDAVDRESPSVLDRFKLRHRSELMVLRDYLCDLSFDEASEEQTGQTRGSMSAVMEDRDYEGKDDGELYAAKDDMVGFLQESLENYTRLADGCRVVNKAAIRRFVAQSAGVKEQTVRHALIGVRRFKGNNQ